MSDVPRRQAPSPLVLTPDPSQHTTSTSHLGSGSNTVSMPFVRRHVTRRLRTAKADCDKELRRVINNITTFFEERLHEGDQDRDVDRDSYRDRDPDPDSQYGDNDTFHDPLLYQHRPVSQADDYSDTGYEAEQEGRHSRQRACPENGTCSLPALTHRTSSPGLLAASTSSSFSPSLRRQSTNPWEKSTPTPSSSAGPSPVVPNTTLSDTNSPRRQSNTIPATAWPSQSLSSRRLSRTVHIPIRPVRSGQSSRSTSRSRSPLPPATTHGSFSDVLPISTVNRRSSRMLVDDPVDPMMTALYDLIGVATDVTEMSTAQLTAQPKVCESLVQRVQHIGKAWDDHPDWHGRNWYVQVLLAVASLSRVVEWWEAEKQFWNFDDNNEDEQDEPLMFVLKPSEEQPPAPTPTTRGNRDEGSLRMSLEDEHRLRMSRVVSQGRRSRDEHPKESLRKSTSPDPTSRSPNKLPEHSESARILATERLRLQAETAQNQNVIMELSLDGDHFLWVNYAWRVVVGTEPTELSGTRISHLLAPLDWTVFKDATQRLQQDDSHTVEVRFRLQVQPDSHQELLASGVLYQQMEGKGMLMNDREDAQPSHTMWVVKPIAPPRYEYPSPSIILESGEIGQESLPEEVQISERMADEPVTPFPFTQPISTEPILCRICECHIPQWYFEKHSETCAEVHHLEAEICECNESIGELKNTIKELLLALDTSSLAMTPEYRGVPIFTPSTSPSMSSPLQLFRTSKMQRVGVKKLQRRLLEQLDDILQVALEVTTPSLKEEESKEPIERQRLLSPTSERKMSQVRNWCKPTIEDAALTQLIEDAERIMRQKVDNVVLEESLATVDYEEESGDESGLAQTGSATPEIIEEAALPQATSESASINSAEDMLSSGPTPVAPSSPIPTAPNENRQPVSMPAPASIPPSWQMINKMPTRSSTPSSISSPLALAQPITASACPDDYPPYMDLNEVPVENGTLRARQSTNNLLEPRLLITPPLSPSILPRDAPIATRRGHRRHSTINPVFSPTSSNAPLSPRQPPAAPLSRSTPTSIKDFDIIKPISKGAFGSVFLAKKKATGDYYAIKVLKKADMIAKNQITNVKAERMILMKQAESPFVAKLYFTFQSKENLYLVMEYLNGGDCAALIKSLGSLPEEWTRQYIAEVVLGLEYLHERGVVHRDLKPDNLLIDQHGHLKLTDFGLSRIGLLGRQTREGPMGMGLRHRTRYDSRSRPPSLDSGFLASPMLPSDGGSYFGQGAYPVSRNGTSLFQFPADDISESGSGSELVSTIYSRRSRAADSPLQSFATELTTDLRSHSGGNTPPGEQKFVGTPDYLAPETILGLRGDDAAVDWWALGVITYEFLYGIPPFHAETPEKVFENILSGQIEWHEDWVDFSDEAKDFMRRLMDTEPATRLGANGADEVKNHPFFEGIEWDKVTSKEAAFIPQLSDPESTDYFDPRGAIPQLFHDDDIAITNIDSPAINPTTTQPTNISLPSNRDSASSPASDDFGSFSFKNLPVLKQANDDVIRKLKTDHLAPIAHTLSDPVSISTRRRSLSQRHKKPPSVVTTIDQKTISQGPPSPSTSTSSIASSPSRASMPPSTPGSSSSNHNRKPSDFGAIERFKLNLDGVERRNTMPSRLRTASISSAGDGSGSDNWPSSAGQNLSHFEVTPPSSVHSVDLRKGPDPTDRAVTCLLAEDNPITAKIIETLLIRLGCRCVVVANGSEAVGVAMGDIKFDCILMDLYMPVLDGESAARYIKSTNNKNTNTPIIAVSAYSTGDEQNGLFAASLSKPLQRVDLLAVMRKLGFKTSAVQGVSHPPVRSIPSRIS
ncbi:RIM15, signal transduction response regulator [Lanmaoa asiatica]|nr:RIM15, signal transduction response regulator [Lanmaoa asiatica]